MARSEIQASPDARRGDQPVWVVSHLSAAAPLTVSAPQEGTSEATTGIEPVTGRQANVSAAVQERLGLVDGTVEGELHACQMELITDVRRSAGEVAGRLGALRRAVLATGARAAGIGGASVGDRG
jgi:hypothetical protein